MFEFALAVVMTALSAGLFVVALLGCFAILGKVFD
jgi:hypothetical protein